MRNKAGGAAGVRTSAERATGAEEGAAADAAPALAPSHDAMRVWSRFLRLHSRLGGVLSARLRALGLTVAQTDLVIALLDREGASQQDIADRLHVTKGNISGLIDRLAGAGLVERRAVEGDRRAIGLHLTERGRRLAMQGLAAQREVVAETLGTWDEREVAALLDLLGRWRDGARRLSGEDRA